MQNPFLFESEYRGYESQFEDSSELFEDESGDSEDEIRRRRRRRNRGTVRRSPSRGRRTRSRSGSGRRRRPRYQSSYPPPSPGGSSYSPPDEDDPPEDSGVTRLLQRLLNRALDLKLPEDGEMSVETRSAIRSFQAGEPLIFQSSPFNLTGESDSKGTRPVQIHRLQQALNETLGSELPIDGVMNFRTRRALRDFQRRAGLPDHGEINLPTVRRLFDQGAPAENRGDFNQFGNRSGFFQESEVSGGTGASAAACPRGLVCLEHVHIPKQPDAARPGQFKSVAPARLEPSGMNTGIMNSADEMMLDRSAGSLQNCLDNLILTKFQNYLSRDAVRQKSASRGDRLRVALFDLTGAKLAKPDFAGWGSTVPMYGASVPKILALYAAFQLRKDLRNLAETRKVSNGRALEQTAVNHWKAQGMRSGFPNLVWLFDIHRWSANPDDLDFSAAARRLFDGIMHNPQAGELIIRVGFPFIASVTWQSGLYHPRRGGLWLSSSYGKGEWGGNPIGGVSSANVTALAAASYFTLLAQGRLVDDASSREMTGILRKGCYSWLFPASLGLVASKCGIWSDYLHDCALIERRGLRYVVAGLTRTQVSEYSKYTQLFVELDRLVERNNQTPKPGC